MPDNDCNTCHGQWDDCPDCSHPTDTETAAMSGVDSSALLAELDDLYKQFKDAKHQATWGGGYETEESARRECSEIAKQIFEKTMDHLELRSVNDKD